ncbi:MAG: zinc ribbon domain-containing protein [Deltaproteobacteria bacterium]|nr:zinc ribbon domain-containing protein [Deltaproteobacteria bacterium]
MKPSDIEGQEQHVAKLARTFGPALLLAVGLAVGVIAGPALGVLVLAGGALLAAIATLWASLRALVGETALAPEDAFALGAPSSEEEQKRAVLRAIKDIEFERTVGKISEEDFSVLLGRYRAEAKRLLRQIDESRAPERARAEALASAFLAKHVPTDEGRGEEPGAKARETATVASGGTPRERGKKRRKGRAPTASTGAVAATEEEAPTVEEAATIEEGMTAADTQRCAACETTNDADATFCKGCGKRLQREEAAS